MHRSIKILVSFNEPTFKCIEIYNSWLSRYKHKKSEEYN